MILDLSDHDCSQKKLEVPGTRKPSDSESIVTDMEGAAEEGPRFHVNQRKL